MTGDSGDSAEAPVEPPLPPPGGVAEPEPAGEGQQPLPAAPTPSGDVKKLEQTAQQTSHPAYGVPPTPGTAAGTPDSSRALENLLSRSPFIDLFCYAAIRSSVLEKHEERVRLYRMKHPRLWTTCFITDYVLRIVVVILLLILISLAAWKTLAPLPGCSGCPAQ